MRIEVYNEKDEPEQVVRLRLIDYGSGDAMLAAVDTDGRMLKHILHIDDHGIKRCYSAVVPGLPTDDKGRVLLVDE